MNENSAVTAIKKMVIGSIIAEYGMIDFVDQTKQELKKRVKNVIRASNEVQSFFLHNEQASAEVKELFKKEFLKPEFLLISEILVALWDLKEDDLEHILNQIKSSTDEQQKA